MRNRLALLLSLCIPLCLSLSTSADDLGLDFTGGNVAFPTLNQTLGWEVSFSSLQAVSALGMFDVGSNGLSAPHLVGIWDTSGTLLGSVTVDNASTPIASTSTAGRWLFQSLSSPLILSPGNYVLGVDFSNNADNVFTGASSLSMATDLAFVQGRFVQSLTPGFDFPNATFSTSGGHFGANLLLTAVPEPTTWALIGLVTLGTGTYAWRKKRRQATKPRFAKAR
jgi:hypothetical protein